MRNQDAKVRLAQLADRQWGRVTWDQIRAIGIERATVNRWRKRGYLHRVLPGVYAVGHRAGDYVADLVGALLYAAPGAMLSHATAAHWLGLLDEKPRQIHITTPRRCRSQRRIVVHERRACDRVWHNDLPVTTLAQTLLDLAADAPLRTVRKALANADYRHTLNIAELDAALGPGRPGSSRLREALRDHQPILARTRSNLEVMFVELCEEARIPTPELNQRIAGWEVDALWREERIAVELDGYDNHRSRAQVKRDRRKEMALRAAGFTPVRYSEEQLTRYRAAVIEEITRLRAR
jgi:predicted transcriptional regulator of viral defense system/very-short-patch-repair endonuclease